MKTGAHRRSGGRSVIVGLCLLVVATFAAPVSAQDAKPAPGFGRRAFVDRAAASTSHGASMLLHFRNAPYPYDGDIPATGKPFFDTADANGRRGHTSPRGGVNWETPTYNDDRVLVHVPRGFDPTRPATIVVFFHGNLATLERDVRDRQGVPRQLEQSHLNAVLVAPQFAVNALDSSSGKFFQPGAFNSFMAEAAPAIAEATGGRMSAPAVAALPIVMVAYSGGYQAAAFSLLHFGASKRVAGVILLDALYGEVDKFADWITARNDGIFFLSAFSRSSAAQNATLKRMIGDQGIRFTDGLPKALIPGVVAFVPALDAVHNDFVTRAWTADPLRAALSLVRPGGGRGADATASPTPSAPRDASPSRQDASRQDAPAAESSGIFGALAPVSVAGRREEPPPSQTSPQDDAPRGNAVIQLGAFPSSDEADSKIRAVQRDFPELTAREFRTEPASEKKPILYRVRVVNLTQDDARALCQRINAKQTTGCYIVPQRDVAQKPPSPR